MRACEPYPKRLTPAMTKAMAQIARRTHSSFAGIHTSTLGALRRRGLVAELTRDLTPQGRAWVDGYNRGRRKRAPLP